MTIHLTEDDDPNGYVTIDFDYDDFELEDGMNDEDLPPVVRLGAELVAIARDGEPTEEESTPPGYMRLMETG